MRRLVAAAALAIASMSATAQSWPEKPVRMVVPFPPAGPLDLVARVFSAKLGERFGQPFLVENRTGATGNIGMDMVAKSAPDGYTLLWIIDAMLTVNPVLYKQFGEPLQRLRTVALLTEGSTLLVISAALKARTVAEFVKLSKASDFSYASAGLGSPGHRAMEYFKLATGAKLTHVPYGGNAAAIQSVVAGQTQAFMTPVAGALANVRAGRLRALTVASEQRVADLPEVPTMIESGYANFTMTPWFGLLAPAKTPQAVVDALYRELARIMAMDDVRARLRKAGLDPVADTAAAMSARAARDRALWTEVIEKTGMKVE
ncbi:MAG: tripartite tricarboxylate transporter substrate binding protein [Burkholderiales bacterium]|nr:tripartite tricarboxylate transporter substrate binding protein [Burkholderiales bacterium]